MAKSWRIGAVGLSVLLHAALILLARRLPPSPKETPSATTVQFELVQASEKLPLDAVTKDAELSPARAAITKLSARRRGLDGPKASAPARDPSLPSVDARTPAPPETSEGRTGGDRLWSFRPAEQLTLSPLVNQLPPEDPQALFRHALPNVLRNPKREGEPKRVESRGDLKMLVDEDGHIAHFEDPKPRWTGLGAEFDLTDVIMRASGKRPYRYEEQRLAETTREDRLCQMVEAQKRNQRQAIYDLTQKLQNLWRLSDTPLSQRQKLIFELWDECTEDGDGGSAGAMARATIEAFVRKHMPEKSPHAFTASLLASVNRERTSRSAFAPYSGVPPSDPLPR